MNNTNEGYKNKSLQAQIVAQWITSLAISVVCCAVLFIVFAGYIVELHDTTNLLSVKLEVLQERHNQLNSELAMIKRPTVVQINNGVPKAQNAGAPEAPPAAMPAEAVPPAPASPPPAPEEPKMPQDIKDDLMPILNDAEPPEQAPTKPVKEQPHGKAK